ncbi:MAG: Coenzyme F420 hydrogenase/dehydrogenase, beta subunit C-terminal domain [Chelatococcus sp.]|nr:Coenzyme F420 hydrogenase/dehydrogenase, beta subunit C-terminal domain [Chelatococcus sp. YT9]MBX3556744.1 Coenzyme F420 hydrogenase/dehydrogenase, beta subunit C-terminal domain [Chelatococcus sp.]
MGWDAFGQLKPHSSRPGIRPDAFAAICPFSPLAANEDEIARERFPHPAQRDELIGCHEAVYVGHVAEGNFRHNGSSGGLVTWVASELMRADLVDAVAHVVETGGHNGGRFFDYSLTRDPDALPAGAKSRYYPVELSRILQRIRDEPGRYAVVGVPCFIKAVHLLRRHDPMLRERIVFTLGLFCGHMKSARLAESFAWQMDVPFGEVERLDFRVKNESRPANWYRAHFLQRSGAVREEDWWNLVDGDWGAGFFQNSACNFCDDVVAETADIAFGDAWVEPFSSDGRGTNVVIIRSPTLLALVRRGLSEKRLSLEPVDAAFVKETQAAGFRQRREGLAYRLSWHRTGLKPKKRVLPGMVGLAIRRRLIYRARYSISRWSHRLFHLARRLHTRWLYTGWARCAGTIYQGLAYSTGPLGRLFDWIEQRYR